MYRFYRGQVARATESQFICVRVLLRQTTKANFNVRFHGVFAASLLLFTDRLSLAQRPGITIPRMRFDNRSSRNLVITLPGQRDEPWTRGARLPATVAFLWLSLPRVSDKLLTILAFRGTRGSKYALIL